ncbi:putative origin recognition complex subunit orc5 protein [Podospora australis]|uniref:Origin recognition complex subunit orc5 protein n=1 Tax=Podospora australis TaxID=1536484 RepID=A0AAN6X2G7_9PEZI|nr:putative origin recognition complex subunit orc5 protein [Podospora australis]
MTVPLFQLPDELLLTQLAKEYPCREPQIRALSALLDPSAAPCRNLVLYGTEATGKTAITTSLLSKLEDRPDADISNPLEYTIVNSIECITARHLYETVVGKVANALQWDAAPSRCETVSQLTVELCKMLKYTPRPDNFRFVLVFDAIDRQRDAPHTLLPALARLSEIIPSLTTIFIVTSPPPNLLHTSFVPHLQFPAYTKSDFVTILTTHHSPSQIPNASAAETSDLWARFVAAVHDALARAACRTLPAFLQACRALWPRFTHPIAAGTHSPKEFSKLLVLARVHFQDETLLDPGVISSTSSSATSMPPPTSSFSAPASPVKSTQQSHQKVQKTTDLAVLLPTTARLLLLSAYLASHNATRHDLTLFSTHHHGKRRRRGGLSVAGVSRNVGPGRAKHRKIARKLLGAHAFVLERMLAIFTAVRGEWDPSFDNRNPHSDQKETGATGGNNADIGMAIATLASLRLLVRVGGVAGGDPMDCGGKWRVNVGWEVVRGLGRSIGVEVEDWLIE